MFLGIQSDICCIKNGTRKKAAFLCKKRSFFVRKRLFYIYITMKILVGILKLQRIDVKVKCHDQQYKIYSLLSEELILASVSHGPYFQ